MNTSEFLKWIDDEIAYWYRVKNNHTSFDIEQQCVGRIASLEKVREKLITIKSPSPSSPVDRIGVEAGGETLLMERNILYEKFTVLEKALIEIQEYLLDWVELARTTPVYKIADKALSAAKKISPPSPTPSGGAPVEQEKKEEEHIVHRDNTTGKTWIAPPSIEVAEVKEAEKVFADLKWKIGGYMELLTLNKAGTAIEANPATHRIAEYVFALLGKPLYKAYIKSFKGVYPVHRVDWGFLSTGEIYVHGIRCWIDKDDTYFEEGDFTLLPDFTVMPPRPHPTPSSIDPGAGEVPEEILEWIGEKSTEHVGAMDHQWKEYAEVDFEAGARAMYWKLNAVISKHTNEIAPPLPYPGSRFDKIEIKELKAHIASLGKERDEYRKLLEQIHGRLKNADWDIVKISLAKYPTSTDK